MIPQRQFLAQLENFNNEACNVARYAYADFAIQHAASRSAHLLQRLNDTPTFWLAARAAFQTAAYISLGRIFDQNSDYNLGKLLRSAESNIALFQRDALADRKREGYASDPPWLREYLDKAYFPGTSDFTRLKKTVEVYRNLYVRVIKPARDKYIAHREKRDHAEVAALFGRGKIKDLCRLAVFLQQIHDVLWQLYSNGRKPEFRPTRYSVAAMFNKPSTRPC